MLLFIFWFWRIKRFMGEYVFFYIYFLSFFYSCCCLLGRQLIFIFLLLSFFLVRRSRWTKFVQQTKWVYFQVVRAYNSIIIALTTFVAFDKINKKKTFNICYLLNMNVHGIQLYLNMLNQIAARKKKDSNFVFSKNHRHDLLRCGFFKFPHWCSLPPFIEKFHFF